MLSFDVVGVPKATLPGFDASLEVGLATTGYTITRDRATTAALLAEAPGPTAGCRVGPCLAAAGKMLGVTHFVVVAVTVRGAQYDIVMSLLEAQTGQVVGQTLRTCPVCTLDEALIIVSEAAEAIGSSGNLEAPPTRTRIVVVRPAKRVKHTSWRKAVGGAGMLLGMLTILGGVALDENGRDGLVPMLAAGTVGFWGGALLVGTDDVEAGFGRAGRRGRSVSLMGIQKVFTW